MRSWKDEGKVKAHVLHKDIKWEFSPPAVSHMGGIWERQIRSVRKVLNITMREQTLDDKRLSTLFCEVESIVNGRPMTQMMKVPWRQIICCSFVEDLTYPPLSLIRVIYTEGVGDMFSFCLTSSGNAEYVSTYLFCNYAGNGWPQREICRSEMLCSSRERTPPEELADGAWNPDLPSKGRTSQDSPSENKVVHLDQTSQAVPIGSCGGQHVNIYLSLLYSVYVLTMNTDGQS